MNLFKCIKGLAVISALTFILADPGTSPAFGQAGQKEETTYVESLFDFFRKGAVVELPDFPDTEVFKGFLQEEAKHKGLTEEELKARMKEKGITSYLLILLGQRHISPVDFANLLDISWIQAFQIAYSSGAMRLTDESLELLRGNVTETIRRLRKDKDIVVKEIAYRSSVDDLYPLYAEIAYDPGLRSMPVVVYQHGDYPGTRFSTVPGIYDLAKRGIFGISVSKRGREDRKSVV